MNSTLFLTGFGAYVLFLIWLGWFVSRNQKSGEDFLLGGRGLPLFLVLGTTVATMVGTGSSMGAVGFGYSNGWAGALYGIGAPGLNPNTVRRCQKINMPIVPGVNNPSQVEQALELGLNFLKFFPAEASGGIAMVKSLLAPYVDVSLMPTGGIGENNVNDYLAIDRVICCGGTWMVAPSLIENEQWDEIGKLVREAVELVA
ncbi:bifunctional 4-hydroxy-2-oxoglutarate aldolase/2-dehydro-3-deoxy-phosphogluconate aldolase [Vibrio sp. VNB-15]